MVQLGKFGKKEKNGEDRSGLFAVLGAYMTEGSTTLRFREKKTSDTLETGRLLTRKKGKK